MKARLKIAFADFWPGFNLTNNYFTRVLSSAYELDFSNDPDLLVFSCFGEQHHRFKCIKVFYTGENVRPDFRYCDYAFSFDYLDRPNHYRLPLWVTDKPEELVKQPFDPARTLAGKTHFCNFVYSNPHCEKRNRFFHQLSQYKRVDSGGKHLNNLGACVHDKFAFMRRYKFTIAFENSSHPGYVTEKIAHPMKVGSLPIYWGDPLVHRDFNSHSFLNYHDYGSDEKLIERIVALDQNDDLYIEMLKQPWLPGNTLAERWLPESVLKWFQGVIASTRKAVAFSPLYPIHRIGDRARQNVHRLVRKVKRHLKTA